MCCCRSIIGPEAGIKNPRSEKPPDRGFVGLPGGATAVYNSSGLQYYRHSDWLGSSRLASTTTRTVYSDTAYGAYGEAYAESGTQDRNFTGQDQDIVPSGSYPLYDFLMREYHPTWGRWVSPDPAGLAAANPGNPQSWNRYAYVLNNPTNFVDPLGLRGEGGGYPCTVLWFDNIYCLEGGTGGGGSGNGGGPCVEVFHNGSGGGACGGGATPGRSPIATLPLTPIPGLKSLIPYPCPPTGNAPSPAVYESLGKSEGRLLGSLYLPSFQRGAALDAQASGGSIAYGNYAYGVYMAAAGYKLPFSLWGANFYAWKSGATQVYKAHGYTMDSVYKDDTAANIGFITLGYNDEKNGTLCTPK
jgi:RHS repeat-associated protein